MGTIFVFSLCLAPDLGKELVHMSGTLAFAVAAKGAHPLIWLWWPAGLTFTVPTGL